MTKMQAYRELQDRGAGFLANVITLYQGRAALKLKGAVNLLRSGRDVRTAQFSLDTLLVDGSVVEWDLLDAWGKVK